MTTQLVTLEVDETLSLAEELMRLVRIRHLPVIGEGDRLLGLVSHRDLLGAQASSIAHLDPADDKAFKRTIAVRELMTREVITISPHSEAVEAAKIMRTHKIGCLPVVEDGILVGVLTEADFLDLVIRALDRSGPVNQDEADPLN